MISNIWKHWKSTLTGAAIAAGQVAISGLNWKSILIAAAQAFFGALVQDPGAGKGTQNQAGMGRTLPIIFLAALVCASPASAQTPAPAPQPSHQNFVVSATATQNGTTETVAMAAVGFQLTEYYSVSMSRIWNPNDSHTLSYNLGDFNGTYELGDLLPAKIKKALVFDTTNWIVTFQGSAGKVTGFDPKQMTNVNHVAEGLGIYLSRPFANNVQLTCGYRFIHGVRGATWIKVPAAGFNFTF